MLKPNKHKGQHWLISKKYLKKIVESARIKKGETVLEIGPGTGNLTEELLSAGANIIAVEKDRNLVGELKLKIKNSKLQIIESDILKFDETKITPPYKIVANIPYYITGPIIQKFLRSANPPTKMILLVQKEVGERICAQPPRANYLSSLVQSFAETKILFKVSKENFWPKPKVDSVVIKISPHIDTRKTIDPMEFIKFLRIVFRQPRQTLTNNLKRGKVYLEKIDAVFSQLKIPKNIRPQNLNVETLIKIFEITKI